MQVGKIWLDGKMVAQENANVSVLTHSLHYGVAVFEGVRAYQTHDGRTAIFRLDEHTDRLINSAKIFMLQVPFDKQTLMQAQKQAVRENGLTSAYLRPLAWLGDNSLGMSAKNSVHAMVAAWEWGAYLGGEALSRGIRVKTSSYTHHLPNTTMSKAKTSGNYPVSVLANAEARACGFGEAILLDPAGYVCQGAGENLFIVIDGVLHTPDLACGALDGITRRTIIQFAQDLGIAVIERRITRDECYLADEMFMTGTAAEITPIYDYDGRIIGAGQVGVLTKQLQDLYFATVQGKRDEYAHWLSYI